MKKRIIAIGLIAILLVSTLAGCSCTNNGTSKNSNNAQVTAYKCDFEKSDIAIPEGTKLTDNGLEVTDKADALVKNVLDIEKQLPALVSRDGENPSSQQNYMQDCNKINNSYQDFNYANDYNDGTTDKFNDISNKVKDYAVPLAKTAYSFYKGDYSAGFNGVKDCLKSFGIFSEKPEVSNEQILDEVKQVRMEVEKVYSQVQQLSLETRDMRSMLSAMSNQLDDVAKQTYRNGLDTFDNAMIALDTDAEIIQKMLVIGAQLLEQQGVYAPTEDASPEEAQEYNAKLIATIEEQQNTNPDLKNFDTIMKDLINNYVLVAGELGKGKDFSPLTAYDSYWNTYFNWDSQGYALKVAYRSNAEFQVKRGYSMITLYYNIGTGDTAQTYEKYGTLFNNALASMSENKPGISPDDVANSRHKNREFNRQQTFDVQFANLYQTSPWIDINLEGGLYSSTFDKHLVNIYQVDGTKISDEIYNMSAQMPKEQVVKYHEKMHGKTLRDELKLAGLYDEDMAYLLHDLAFDFTKEGDNVKIDWLYVEDNKLYEADKINDTDNTYNQLGYIYKKGEDAPNMPWTEYTNEMKTLYGFRVDMMFNLK